MIELYFLQILLKNGTEIELKAPLKIEPGNQTIRFCLKQDLDLCALCFYFF